MEKLFRNSIIKAVQAGGVDPGQFDFDLKDDDIRIAHRWSESRLTLHGPWGDWKGSYVAGDSSPWPIHAISFSQVEESVEHWVSKVKRDLETPDLLAELQRQRELLSQTPDEAENTPFTPDEQAQIVAQLKEIKDWVKRTHALTPEQTFVLEEEFKGLRMSVARLGRVDWRLRFLGVLFVFLGSGILPQEVVQGLLMMALHGLQEFFGGSPPPQLGPV